MDNLASIINFFLVFVFENHAVGHNSDYLGATGANGNGQYHHCQQQFLHALRFLGMMPTLRILGCLPFGQLGLSYIKCCQMR